MNKRERIMANVLAIGFVFMIAGILLSLAQSAVASRATRSSIEGSAILVIIIGLVLVIVGIIGMLA